MTTPADAPARRITEGRANDQLLYFTSPSLTADGRTLIFISDRDSPITKAGDPHVLVNLYALDRDSGEVRRLTDNADGYLRSYVYGVPNGGEWISTLRVNWEPGTIEWQPRCRHGSSWISQDAHPHPVFSPDGREVLFTSDKGGWRAVYALATSDASPAPSHSAVLLEGWRG